MLPCVVARVLGGAGVVVSAAALAVAAAQPSTAASSPAPAAPGIVQRFVDPRLTESSGLVASRRHPGLLWTVADSGNPAEVYGVRDGRVVAVARVRGARNVDWEALAVGRDGRLWVGDVGDNAGSRRTVSLLALAEPPPEGRSRVSATSYSLRYPDGPHDAETVLVDPTDGSVLVVTKAIFGAGYYRVPVLDPGRPVTMRRVAPAPAIVTDGAYAPDGSRLALRGYGDATVFDKPGGPGTDVTLPRQPQGESLAWTPDGEALLVGSEGRASPVWRVPLPPALVSAPAPSAAAAAAASAPTPGAGDPDGPAGPGGAAAGGRAADRASGGGRPVLLVGGIALALAGVAAVLRAVRRSPR